MILLFVIGLLAVVGGAAADIEVVVGGAADDIELDGIEYLAWTRDNSGNSQATVMKYQDESSLQGNHLSRSRPTVVIIHGWHSNGRRTWVMNMKTDILAVGSYNVISVDWGYIAKLNYLTSQPEVENVGQRTARMLIWLQSMGLLDIRTVHVVGHSLGAHVAGNIGRYFRSATLARITGLDPASPGFSTGGPLSSVHRLSSSDAAFVDVIHTNAGYINRGCVGIRDSLGHVDFYPNGGYHQPLCSSILNINWMDLAKGGCSHEMAIEYFSKSILDPQNDMFKSYPCSNWANYKYWQCDSCGDGCEYMGFHLKSSARGTFFHKIYVEGGWTDTVANVFWALVNPLDMEINPVGVSPFG